MPRSELDQLINRTISSMDSDVSDDSLLALRVLLPENMIIAAFDLIDRGKVFTYKTSWGRSFFDVYGSRGHHAVSVDLPSPVTAYCTCPAFVYCVLLSEDQVMCKHVLAVLIARRLGKCVERTVTPDELVALLRPDSGADQVGPHVTS